MTHPTCVIYHTVLSVIGFCSLLVIHVFKAMHLVYRALERNPVPVTLPPEMIPPSKRKRGAGLAGAVSVMPGGGVMPGAAMPPAAAAAAAPVVPGGAVPLVPGVATVPVSTAGRASPTSVSTVVRRYCYLDSCDVCFPSMARV